MGQFLFEIHILIFYYDKKFSKLDL